MPSRFSVSRKATAILAATLVATGLAATTLADSAQAIVGGKPVEQAEYPFMVRLSMHCGGSLYSPRLVLTAAHCVDDQPGPNENITVTAGVTDLEDPAAIKVQSEYVYSARDENGGPDWALIKLQEPIDLPTLKTASTPEYNNGTFTVAGWGLDGNGEYPRHLQQVELPFVDDATCDEIYPGQDAEAEICAGDLENGGVDSCWSDSGGPLFRRDDEGEWIQVGIVSHSRTGSCGLPGSPSVYTQVSTFHDKIAEVAASLDG